jgi:hypothetical protein
MMGVDPNKKESCSMFSSNAKQRLNLEGEWSLMNLG